MVAKTIVGTTSTLNIVEMVNIEDYCVYNKSVRLLSYTTVVVIVKIKLYINST